MNKVILMGRLTRDPEVRYGTGENSTAVARYTIAVDRRFKRDGEQSADFIGCVAFGRNAEFAEKYLRQGNYNRPSMLHSDDADGFMNIPDGIDDDDEQDIFAEAGLDYDELEFMDPKERRKVLEEAGLDPDEFDF